MAKHKPIELLLGYEKDAEYGSKFKTVPLTGNVSRTRTRPVRAIISSAESVLRSLSYSSIRGYGMFLLGFGVLALILHLVRSYTAGDPIPLYVIITGLVLAALGVVMTVFDRPFVIALQDFPLTDFIFFEFFCIKRMHRIDVAAARHSSKESEHINVIPPFVFLVIGLLLAALSMLVPMWTLMLGVGALVYLFLTFVSPEFSFFATFLIMPYLPALEHSDVILAATVFATFLSFIVKVLLGKRVYYLEQYDMLLGLFLVFVLISGVFVKGIESFGASLVILLFAMGYVLASSLITNRRLADCVIKALIVSAIPVSVHTTVLGAIAVANGGLRGFGGVSATFGSPSALALYLLVAAVFALYYVRALHHPGARVGCFFIFALIFVALFFTARTWAFIAGMFGVLAYCVGQLRRGGPVLVGVVALLPNCLLFLGPELLRAIDRVPVLSAIGFDELADRWSASFQMLADNLFVGVGIGSDSFMSELADYSSALYPDSGNFLLEIGCEAGILALASFVLMIVVRLVHRVVYRRYAKGSEVHHLTDFSSVAMTVILAYGAVNYLWSDLTLNYLYWCVFGIGSAVLRVSKRDNDDRIAYFSDGRSRDSSSVDLDIA